MTEKDTKAKQETDREWAEKLLEAEDPEPSRWPKPKKGFRMD